MYISAVHGVRPDISLWVTHEHFSGPYAIVHTPVYICQGLFTCIYKQGPEADDCRAPLCLGDLNSCRACLCC